MLLAVQADVAGRSVTASLDLPVRPRDTFTDQFQDQF